MTIRQIVHVNAGPERTWQAWTRAEELTRWLTAEAHVEPRVGGPFELFWNPANHEVDSTIGCQILALREPEELQFNWKGPKELAHVMNTPGTPLTQVTVSLRPAAGGTEVTLVHTGWGEGPDWEQARQWHVKAWEMALGELQKHLDGGGGAPCCR